MSLVVLVIVAAVVTYASRVAAMAVRPPPTGRLARLIERLPAPLFAGLAVLALMGDGSDTPGLPTLAAALAALAVAPMRSLPMALVAGLAAFGLVTVFL